jgi:hypothetical protein
VTTPLMMRIVVVWGRVPLIAARAATTVARAMMVMMKR